jgi:hypothetical protein
MTALTTRRSFMTGAGMLLVATGSAFAATGKNAKRPRQKRRIAREPENLDPTAIVNGIYKRAIKDVDGRVVTLSFAKGDRRINFSAALVALWAKVDAKSKGDEDVGPIDFDPVTNSQGVTVKSFVVATENQDEASTTLAVTIETTETRETAEDKTVRYDFVREDGRWRIDDIRGTVAGKPWSIKQLLTRAAA